MRHVPRLLETQVLRATKDFSRGRSHRPKAVRENVAPEAPVPPDRQFSARGPGRGGPAALRPQGFLDSVETPTILDEVQNVPEVFAYVRTRLDRRPRRVGQWILTGSQEAPLMANVSESMAGRAAVLQLLPLSVQETRRVTMLRGGYPEALARPREARLWFASYLQTYLERDVRQIVAVRDLATFRRFLAVLATSCIETDSTGYRWPRPWCVEWCC